MNLRSVLASATVAFLSGCASDFQFDEMEVQFRCAAPDTTAGVLIVEKGIHGGSGERAVTEALRTILEGRRRFPPEGGFISLDLDDADKKSAAGSGPQPDEIDRKFVELGHGFRVEKTGLFEDEKGRLCLYQFWTLEDPGRVVAWLNEQTNVRFIEQAGSNRPSTDDFPYLDEESRTRALARARAGGRWIRFEDGGLVCDLPITRACAAKCAADLVEKEDLRKDFGPFLTQASSLEISEERTLLRYRPSSSGWFGPWRTEFENHGDDRLHAWIKAGALPIGSPPDLRELEKILGIRDLLKSSPK